jgi:hypothetical protein
VLFQIYLTKNTKKISIRKWWDWRVQNWGTKWNIEALDEDRITVKDNTVIFDCETAWSPPLEAFAELENKGF